MSTDHNRMTDAFHIAMERARALKDGIGLTGFGVIEHRDEHGHLIVAIPFANKITDTGDLYYAQMAIKGVSPANPTAPATLVSRMKLGTTTTAEGKNTTGHVLGAYVSGSVQAFDATYPQTANLGAGLGVNAVYKTTWAAGTATNSAITEAIITTDTGTTVGAAGDTISRVVFTAVNKGASDTLAITWNHKFLGA